jgi:hypothetical protein
MQRLGLVIVIVSFLPWLTIPFVVPFLPLSLPQKTLLVLVQMIAAEVLFWLGVLLVGQQALWKYQRYWRIRLKRCCRRGV